MLPLLLATAALAGPNGTYTLAVDDAARQAEFDRAIDASADAFPRLFRSIVRGKLEEVPTHCQTYIFAITDAAVQWQCDDHKPIVVPSEDLDTEQVIKFEGKKFPMVATWEAPVLTARFEADKGTRTNVFTFADDGTFTLEATVEADRLPIPVAWSLPYQGPKAAPDATPTVAPVDATPTAPEGEAAPATPAP